MVWFAHGHGSLPRCVILYGYHNSVMEEEEEEERLLWQINNNTMLYMISFAKETPIKTCNMSLAWEPPYYNDIIILI